jgi:hypothetical protein
MLGGVLVRGFNRERRREAVGGDPFPFSLPLTHSLLIASSPPFAFFLGEEAYMPYT